MMYSLPTGAVACFWLLLVVISEVESFLSFSTTPFPRTTPLNCRSGSLDHRIENITAIASDVDGTLLSTDHTLSDITKKAIELAVKEVSRGSNDGDNSNNNKAGLKYFFPATGKSRRGALDSLGPDIRALLENLPGVFVQGLYCVDANGQVIYEQTLPNAAVVAAEAFALEHNVTLIANCRDVIYSTASADPKQLDDVNAIWGEPVPTIVNCLADDVEAELNKLVFMSDDADLLHNVMRPKLEKLAEQTGVTVTTSHISVLELLPRGCSKALGVQKLCEHLGIDPTTELLAMGDAENDVELLKMAAIGVAMGNASPIAKDAADVVMKEGSDEGAAGIAMKRYSCLRDAHSAIRMPSA